MNTDLITRLEAATGNERGLFEEAYFAIYGIWPGHVDASHPRYEHSQEYKRKLDAQAWESAVRMLLPEGFRITVQEADSFHVTMTEREPPRLMFTARAHTEANAFAAACLKAKEQSNG